MTIPAGWYDDGSGRQRWWDGQQWTEHLVEAPTPAPGPADSTASAHPVDAAQSADAAAAASVASTPSVDATAPNSDAAPFTPPFELPGPGASAAQFAAQPTAYPGYSGSAPPYATAPATAPAKKGLSVLGLVGLIVAVVGIVVSCIPPIAVGGWVLLGLGFVLSIVSLFLRGAKWPGFLGLGASGLGAILAVAVALLSFTGSVDPTGPVAEESTAPSNAPDAEPTPVDPADIDGAVMKGVLDLTVGDCIPLIDYGDKGVYEVPVVPCDQPHTDEVYFVFDAAEEPEFPGDDALETEAITRCEAEFETFVGTTYAESELDYYYYTPTKRSWTMSHDRAIQCVLFSYEDVTGSLAGSAR